MEPQYLYEFIGAVFRELSRKRLLVTFLFCLISLTVLVVGIFWPLNYTTSATLYVDQRNIIEPLLRGQAEVTRVDQAQQAKEKVYTRSILENVAKDAGLVKDDTDPKTAAAILSGLQRGIDIRNIGPNYLRVSYSSSSPDLSFKVVDALINAFIRNIAESKQLESKEAFDFIQSQVDVYKAQLLAAEQRLEKFNAENTDGSEETVNQRIADLRTQIETLNLSIDEIRSRKNTIENQLKNEREYLNVRSQSDVYRQQISEAQARLDNMLIHLTETHPDVVNLRMQIEDYKRTILEIERQDRQQSSPRNGESQTFALNPLFEELRSNLSEAEIQLNSSIHRRDTLSRLLAEELERSKRLAAKSAELSELNRDYGVTRQLYEDMLNRKERARLSMTLDVEGQGTSYKVHEPPTFPLKPTGLTANDFLLLAPIAGILFPLGLIVVFVFLDPRIRLPSELLLLEHCEVLAITPPVRTSKSNLLLKKDTILSLTLILSGGALYAWISLNYILVGVA